MTYTAEAIIFKSFPYNDSSLIVKAYTKDSGLQSFILRSSRGKKNSNTKIQHFQPLRLVQLELSSNPKAQLHSIKSSTQVFCCDKTSCNIIKTTLAIFITEVLNVSIKENTANEELFNFLKSQIQNLECTEEKDLAEFHLHFLLELSSILGFCPNDNHDCTRPYFDLTAGKFVSDCREYETLSAEASLKLHKLLDANQNCNCKRTTCSNIERKELLDILIRFYAIHITAGKMIHSQDILSVVLS